MPKFVSRYRKYMVKGPKGVIRFTDGQCTVTDPQEVEFLRWHPSNGNIFFEDKVVETVQYVCPNCRREFKNSKGLAAHLKSCQGQGIEDE